MALNKSSHPDYLTIREAIEQAADVWFSDKLIEINRDAISKPRPQTRFKKSRGIKTIRVEKNGPGISEEEWGADLASHVAEFRVNQAEESRQKITNDTWLKLKGHLEDGGLCADAIPCSVTLPRRPNYAAHTQVRAVFWKSKEISEGISDGPIPFGIKDSPHFILIASEKLEIFLHQESRPDAPTTKVGTTVKFTPKKSKLNKSGRRASPFDRQRLVDIIEAYFAKNPPKSNGVYKEFGRHLTEEMEKLTERKQHLYEPRKAIDLARQYLKGVDILKV
jgi:hypothetical protein